MNARPMHQLVTEEIRRATWTLRTVGVPSPQTRRSQSADSFVDDWLIELKF